MERVGTSAVCSIWLNFARMLLGTWVRRMGPAYHALLNDVREI